MFDQINISNFRSIEKQSLPLKKINILYGPNGSGKSSVMYAPYVFRNFCLNPNQREDSLFNLGFINLGGFDNVANQKKGGIFIGVLKSLSLNIKEYRDILPFEYRLALGNVQSNSDLYFNAGSITAGGLAIDHPYTLTTQMDFDFLSSKLVWNGLSFDRIDNKTESRLIAAAFNSVYEDVKNIELISVKRGFFSPIFSTEQPTEESEFAFSIRQQEKDFESKIDHYFRKIFDKTFRFVAIPGSTSFYLRTQGKNGSTIDLVNEGFGVNQTIYMLIKLLKRSTSLAFIEEPEIHLHPSAQNKLVDVFSEIATQENKQIFLTTHSENIVSGFLRKIANGELNKDDVQFNLAKIDEGKTIIIPQIVSDKGQIEGGLMSFMETELENLRALLGL